ncbi:acyl-CoA dehydrogenase family member 11 isoform X4 [Oncorhynchus tshawytscha]|uniref:acyl-CoA dehydrogenase family member 11 isoform X4 n=1 Tax=Oncorhynchus tshawytscha TaxID=74940 RepID=UPI000D0A3B41|nr:acyl-CoA dehydrogenase family member 11 isoform X4 [Oncorhynchus tshawytscha]
MRAKTVASPSRILIEANRTYVCGRLKFPMSVFLPQWPGVPTPEDLISIYCRCRWIPSSLPQGVYVRHVLGNASAPNAARFGQSVEPLAQVGLQIAERWSVSSSPLWKVEEGSWLSLSPSAQLLEKMNRLCLA